MFASAISATGIILAAVAFVVLYVILSVPLWVSLLVAAAVLLVATMLSGGAATRRGHGGHPTHG